MDIAEIRKKAKSAKSAETPPANAAQDSPGDASVIAPELPAAAPAKPEVPARVAPSVEPVPQHVDPLDKLFATTAGFELATEEAYQQALAGQGGGVEQVLQQYLSFQLGKEEYALDIARISEIIKTREFTEIPRVPDFILGIISLRGVVVPVFDLKKRFQLGVAKLTPASRVIVCQSGEVTAGLLVDSINQVISLRDDQLEPPPAVLSGLDRELVEGVGRFQGRMIIVLHLQSVLDMDLT